MLALLERPKKFENVIGNKVILEEIKKRSKTMNFPEFMLFEGESGTGKTTLAYLIAKLLNCEKPIYNEKTDFYEPCNECSSCKDVNKESFTGDIKFFDCSNMGGIAGIKDLESITNYNPRFSKNTIIILDEFQELSKAAKGATLKLFEKSKKNLYFIACTMDSNKIDNAIKSRCVTYKFRKTNTNEIANYLFELFKVKAVELDIEEVEEYFIKEGLFRIAEGVEGNIRKALQYLDRCINGNIYTKEAIDNELDLMSVDTLTNSIYKILNKDNSIFIDLKNIDIEEFYYKCRKILVTTYIYKFNEDYLLDWQKKLSNALLKFNFVELFNIFKFDDKYIFNKDEFYLNLCKYFDVKNVKVIKNKEEEIIKKSVKKVVIEDE